MAKKRTTLDKKKLYDLVQQGKTAQEIMKALNVNLKQSLKSALFDLSVEKGEVLIVPGMDTRSLGNRKLNKVGLQIPYSQVKDYFKVGSEFEMSIDKDKIVLKKV